MVFVGGLILLFWLGILPMVVGGILSGKGCEHNDSPVYRLLAGNMLLWAVFQLLCVPCIILQKSFLMVVASFLLVAGCLFVLGIFKTLKNPLQRKGIRKTDAYERITGIVFCLLLLFQVVCAIVLTYADGDDAFYVAVSSITNSSNTMYMINPYSTGATGLDVRHGLAPFPIWIAFLARISGLHTAMVAHVVVAVYLILLSYCAFYLVGRVMFKGRKRQLSLFMVFVALFVLFGDYSFRTPENFMIARSRQGKAAMGTIIIPMILFLLLTILYKLKEGERVGGKNWLFLTATITAACLCTTLGTFLTCMMVGLIGVCALVVYRDWRSVFKMALCCIPAVCFALLYFVQG